MNEPKGRRRRRGPKKVAARPGPVGPGVLVATPEGVREVAEAVSRGGEVALDTEFHGERVYQPHLYLVQIAVEDRVLAIDPVACPDLTPLVDALAEPHVETVVHAGAIDLSILWRRHGKLPAKVFDTQVAAGFAQLSYPLSLTKLVEKVLGARLGQVQTLSDWSLRPLREEQLAYALEDVRYLLPLRNALLERLAKLDRLDWARQEMIARHRPEKIAPPATLAYRRVSGWGKLREAERAVLRELVVYREEAAATADRPLQHVIADRLLLDVARQCPGSLDELSQHRRMHAGIVRRHGAAILAAVRRGLACPEKDRPPAPESLLGRRDATVADLLTSVLRVICRDAGVATDLVAPKALLAQVARERPETEAELREILGGWRAELLGTPLFGILQGSLAVALDPEQDKIRFVEVRDRSAS